MTKTVAVIKD